MPVIERQSGKPDVPGEQELRDELAAELRAPHETGEPEIIVERPNSMTTHLFVVWTRWEGLEQMVRSRIVLDAYEAARGADEAEKVTAAMGLTPTEADRMGIQR